MMRLIDFYLQHEKQQKIHSKQQPTLRQQLVLHLSHPLHPPTFLHLQPGRSSSSSLAYLLRNHSLSYGGGAAFRSIWSTCGGRFGRLTLLYNGTVDTFGAVGTVSPFMGLVDIPATVDWYTIDVSTSLLTSSLQQLQLTFRQQQVKQQLQQTYLHVNPAAQSDKIEMAKNIFQNRFEVLIQHTQKCQIWNHYHCHDYLVRPIWIVVAVVTKVLFPWGTNYYHFCDECSERHERSKNGLNVNKVTASRLQTTK